MQRHPYFDLLLHTDRELSDHLGIPVVARTTLHEWPLSCVQRLDLADGSRRVYKSAYGPTVESAFYEQAVSNLLLPSQLLHRQDGYESQLIEWLDAPRLDAAGLSQADTIRLGQSLMGQIAAIRGHVPYHLTADSLASWQNVLDRITANLDRLIASGSLTQVGSQSASLVQEVGRSQAVLACLDEPLGLVHSDLRPDNIFITSQGLKVIDWQRPMCAPQALDWADFLERFACVDPIPWVGVGILAMRRLLSIHWFSECAVKWFPSGIPTYDRQIHALLDELANLAHRCQ